MFAMKSHKWNNGTQDLSFACQAAKPFFWANFQQTPEWKYISIIKGGEEEMNY